MIQSRLVTKETSWMAWINRGWICWEKGDHIKDVFSWLWLLPSILKSFDHCFASYFTQFLSLPLILSPCGLTTTVLLLFFWFSSSLEEFPPVLSSGCFTLSFPNCWRWGTESSALVNQISFAFTSTLQLHRISIQQHGPKTPNGRLTTLQTFYESNLGPFLTFNSIYPSIHSWRFNIPSELLTFPKAKPLHLIVFSNYSQIHQNTLSESKCILLSLLRPPWSKPLSCQPVNKNMLLSDLPFCSVGFLWCTLNSPNSWYVHHSALPFLLFSSIHPSLMLLWLSDQAGSLSFGPSCRCPPPQCSLHLTLLLSFGLCS